MKDFRPGITSQVSWVYTDDLEVSCRFYEEDLGLNRITDEGSARIFQVSGDAQIGVCIAFEDRVVEPKGGMITLVTDEVDEWYLHLKSRGLRIEKPPHVLEKFNIYTFFVKDPKGYIIEFQQFLK